MTIEARKNMSDRELQGFQKKFNLGSMNNKTISLREEKRSYDI
jgi:molybdopterin biosynthesis enzyme MoaB